MEDIYRQYIVRRVETKTLINSKRTNFECDLEDESGEKISFDLTIDGCVGSPDYREQYNAIEPYLAVGQLIKCGIVYFRRSNGFSMAMFDFMPMQAYNSSNNKAIDADTYFNRNRGFWTVAFPKGDRINFPGVIEFTGNTIIPLIEDGLLPQVKDAYTYQEGLIWGRRPSLFVSIWKLFFSPKPKQAFSN
jgi:hypothetical protein